MTPCWEIPVAETQKNASTAVAAPAVQQPKFQDGEQAQMYLRNQLFATTYFGKLAHVHGVRPRSQEEAEQLLRMAGKALTLDADEQTKQAAASGSFLDSVEGGMDQVMARNGLAAQPGDDAFRKAAAAYAGNQDIYEAVVTYHQALQAAQAAA